MQIMTRIRDDCMESIVFEVLPPPITWSEPKVDHWCQEVLNLLKRENLLTINIPEIVDEHRGEKNHANYIPKYDNMHFASLLKQQQPELIFIPNKISVRLTQHQFLDWVSHIHKMGVGHLVLVGGEQSATKYPGMQVTEATRLIKTHFPDMKVGGITIFTRKGEAKRLVDKIKAGMDFFFSQVIYEAANLKQVMLTLSSLCQQEKVSMPKIYLSLALASKIKDLEFLKWLGISFPEAVYSYLTEDEAGVQERSLKAVDVLLDELFHFKEKEKLDFGFNIEHILYSNLHLSEQLFKDIKTRLAKV